MQLLPSFPANYVLHFCPSCYNKKASTVEKLLSFLIYHQVAALH